MIHRLIRWSIHNRLVVFLLGFSLIAVGGYSFIHINVEAYPDPAPAIVEVIAQYPGASAEEVERQVTVPLEVALSGMPGLRYSRSKSLFGLAHLRNQFDYGVDYHQAKIDVLNRLYSVQLPAGVRPTIAPTSPTGEIYRYTIRNAIDALGRGVYTLGDLKALEDFTLERQFRRVPRIADVVSFGGIEKRYEIQPDPDRLMAYGVSLDQLEKAIAQNNANAGGDYMIRGDTVQAVRGLGLLGGGRDPAQHVLSWTDPVKARDFLAAADRQRLQEIRQIVLAATNNVPIHVGDVVDGGPLSTGDDPGSRGVLIGSPTRMGRVMLSKPKLSADEEAIIGPDGQRVWEEFDDVVQGVVLLRKGEQSLPALVDVKDKFREINEEPGILLPGVKLDTYYDRTNLINRTTETVRENLFVGLGLVTLILLVFLNHLPSALIVAVNIPLALLFAFAVLYLRGKSANLLSLGAVDFGIIVDSSVIMVESIYRTLTTQRQGEVALTPKELEDKILGAAGEVERSLFYSTIIMVFALLPLFTMQGPEGQIFGPMADTYAFALGGALLLSVTLSPVLCRTFFTRLKPAKDNWIVRLVKSFYLGQLEMLLHRRWLAIAVFAALIGVTAAALPFLGREFMPELEEGNIYIRSTFPVNVSLDEVAEKAKTAMRMLRKYPETSAILCQLGRPDDGTDPTGFYNAEFFVSLKSEEEWPALEENHGWRRWVHGVKRSRMKPELVEEMNQDLSTGILGVDWNFSQSIRDNVMETLSGVKGENSVKIIGPDLDELEKMAEKVKHVLTSVQGIQNVGIFSIKGQTNLELAIDRQKCAMWNVSVNDVQDVLETAVGGKTFSEMVEGEKTFDVTLRWPSRLRKTEDMILEIPVDVMKNRVTQPPPSANALSGSAGLSITGSNVPSPSITGSSFNTTVANLASIPRRRLRDLVTPIDESGAPDPDGGFVQSGASTIYREQGRRLIAVKFSVRGRDLASAVDEAQEKAKGLIKAPYRAEWSGEFQEMQEAVHRLSIVVALSLVLILVLLYLALRSLLDAVVVLSNVVVMLIGGIWALLLSGTNFNISAGVGFISILGVGIMNGLLMVARFNANRAHDLPLNEAIFDGMDKLIRPLTMTALAAILGLLPAAVATRIGSQTQRPLAIAIVGGMIMTLVMTNLIPVLYSFYGHREPPEGAAGIGH